MDDFSVFAVSFCSTLYFHSLFSRFLILTVMSPVTFACLDFIAAADLASVHTQFSLMPLTKRARWRRELQKKRMGWKHFNKFKSSMTSHITQCWLLTGEKNLSRTAIEQIQCTKMVFRLNLFFDTYFLSLCDIFVCNNIFFSHSVPFQLFDCWSRSSDFVGASLRACAQHSTQLSSRLYFYDVNLYKNWIIWWCNSTSFAAVKK